MARHGAKPVPRNRRRLVGIIAALVVLATLGVVWVVHHNEVVYACETAPGAGPVYGLPPSTVVRDVGTIRGVNPIEQGRRAAGSLG